MSKALSIAIDGMLLGGQFSGVEESILGLAQSLAADGKHNYKFYIPESANCTPPTGPQLITERVKIAPSRLRRLLWEQRGLPRILKSEGYDLLHAPAYLAPLASPIPVILTVYDLQALLLPEFCLPLNRINYRIMLPRSIRKASGIIVPSESVAHELTELFPAAVDKLTVIPIGLNPLFRVIQESEYATTVGRLRIEKPFILFAGNMAANKNLTTLIESFALIKRDQSIPHKLVLAGRTGAHDQNIDALIVKEGLGEEVIRTGYIPEGDLLALYNAATLFAFPSLYEGFGLPPLEAMACGTPVVCSNIDSLTETAGDAAVFADPLDPSAIANAVLSIINDPSISESLRAKGLERAKAFRRRDAMLQTEAFYEKIISS